MQWIVALVARAAMEALELLNALENSWNHCKPFNLDEAKIAKSISRYRIGTNIFKIGVEMVKRKLNFGAYPAAVMLNISNTLFFSNFLCILEE